MKLMEMTSDVVSENLKKIVRSQHLTQRQMDTMLRRMLYDKLCISEPKPKKETKKPKKKPKKKSKFKIREPSSSEESESESD